MVDKSAMGDLTSAATAPGRPPNIRFGIPDNSRGLEVKIFNNLIRGEVKKNICHKHVIYFCWVLFIFWCHQLSRLVDPDLLILL